MPFARRFPEAELWAAPGQWSFPLNTPFEASLWPRRLAGYLADSDSEEGRAAPWGDELQVAVLGVGGSAFTGFRAPWFVDVALHHRPSKTLLVTDAVCQVGLAAAARPGGRPRGGLDRMLITPPSLGAGGSSARPPLLQR